MHTPTVDETGPGEYLAAIDLLLPIAQALQKDAPDARVTWDEAVVFLRYLRSLVAQDVQ